MNIKERTRLDMVEAHVRSLSGSVEGYLCDSIITDSIDLDCSVFPFPVTVKPFAVNQHDFEKVYKDKTGTDFDWDPLTSHERERFGGEVGVDEVVAARQDRRQLQKSTADHVRKRRGAAPRLVQDRWQ